MVTFIRSYYWDWMRMVDEHTRVTMKAEPVVGFRDSEGPRSWEHTPANSVNSG